MGCSFELDTAGGHSIFENKFNEFSRRFFHVSQEYATWQLNLQFCWGKTLYYMHASYYDTGRIVRMDNDKWVKKCMTLEVNGRRDPGRPKKTWEQVIASDLRELGVTRSLAQDRLNWRKTIVMNSLTHASME